MHRHHAGKAAAPVFAVRALAAQLAALTQQANDFFAQFPARQHVYGLIDRLVRDLLRALHVLQPARNLLRRPALAYLAEHMFAQTSPLGKPHRPAPPALRRPRASAGRVITAPGRFARCRDIAPDLPRNRRNRPSERRGDLAPARFEVQFPLNEIALKRAQMFVMMAHKSILYADARCTSNLRPPSYFLGQFIRSR
jgi:hypothetical protein